MEDVVLAEGMALLHTGGEALPVSVSIGRPIERLNESSLPEWTVKVIITVGDQRREYTPPTGADSLGALLAALVKAAHEVNRLRQRGRLSREGRPGDYFCLDELLRTPATGGYLPTGIDRPAKGAGQA